MKGVWLAPDQRRRLAPDMRKPRNHFVPAGRQRHGCPSTSPSCSRTSIAPHLVRFTTPSNTNPRLCNYNSLCSICTKVLEVSDIAAVSKQSRHFQTPAPRITCILPQTLPAGSRENHAISLSSNGKSAMIIFLRKESSPSLFPTWLFSNLVHEIIPD